MPTQGWAAAAQVAHANPGRTSWPQRCSCTASLSAWERRLPSAAALPSRPATSSAAGCASASSKGRQHSIATHLASAAVHQASFIQLLCTLKHTRMYAMT